MIVSKVQRWGNSQGLRLARQILDQVDIAIGDEVEIVIGEREIVVRKAAPAKRKYEIRDLVAKIPKDYKPEEVSFGPAAGKEEW